MTVGLGLDSLLLEIQLIEMEKQMFGQKSLASGNKRFPLPINCPLSNVGHWTHHAGKTHSLSNRDLGMTNRRPLVDYSLVMTSLLRLDSEQPTIKSLSIGTDGSLVY